MFKVAFHGGFNNVWNGVMTIPEVCNNHILPYLTFPQGTPDQTLHDGAHGVRLLRDLEEGGPADHGPHRPHAQHVRKEAGREEGQEC